MNSPHPSALTLALAVALLGVAGAAFADRTENTESATVRTKTIYDDDGNVVYQANWDKATGKPVGTILDRRRKGQKKQEKASAKPKVAYEDEKDAYFKTEKGIFIKADTLLKIEILTHLSSKKSRKGDAFRFRVVNTFHYAGAPVIPQGATGEGQVVSAHRRGGFGRAGHVKMQFGYVKTVGSRKVQLVLSRKAVDRNRNEGYAAGASVFGAMLLGPIGLAGGALVKGHDVDIPVGSMLWVAVENDVDVTGDIGSR